jgi:formylglycine-generating enzyme required for sulfatase activity
VRGWQRAEGSPGSDAHLPIGAIFQDAPFAPEMVVVPAGTFIMGSGDGETPVEMLDGSRGDVLPKEEGRDNHEGPQHEVTIPQPFAVGRYAVTFEEWDAAQGDADWQRVTGLEPRTPDDEGWGRGKRPVINVSWNDSRAYAKWLSEETGKTYRLLSEAEWEYAARAGTTGPFSFDGPITTDKANYDGDYSYAGSPKGEDRGRTVPVDSFQPNPWGLYQVHGNVWEWVEDCWNDSYSDKPDSLKVSGSAWTAGNCDYRLLRGGSWGLNPQLLRSASRVWNFRVYRGNYIGFRLARTLTPAAKSASACRELADTLSARVEVREGDQFCDAARQHTARVERIGDQSIRFVVDGGKKFTCREGELCGFDWSPGPTFRVTARADRARGIEPQGALLPR